MAASLSPSGGWPAPRCLHPWAPACSETTRPRSAFSPTSPSLTRDSTSLSPVWTPSVIHHFGGREKSETGVVLFTVQVLLTTEKRTDSERLQHETLEVYWIRDSPWPFRNESLFQKGYRHNYDSTQPVFVSQVVKDTVVNMKRNENDHSPQKLLGFTSRKGKAINGKFCLDVEVLCLNESQTDILDLYDVFLKAFRDLIRRAFIQTLFCPDLRISSVSTLQSGNVAWTKVRTKGPNFI